MTHCAACRILAPWSETKPEFSFPREVKQLNHWVTMKVPRVQMYMDIYVCVCVYIYIFMWLYIQSCDYINSVWSEDSTHNVIRVNKNLRISVLCNIVTNTIAWQISQSLLPFFCAERILTCLSSSRWKHPSGMLDYSLASGEILIILIQAK